jgi:hypothetical protein
MFSKLKTKLEKLIFPILLIAFLLIGFLANIFVMNQFGGYDLSPLVDLTWRFKLDQIPGEDYLFTWPLLILVFAKILSLLENYNWLYLTNANILLCFAIFVYGTFLIKKHKAKNQNTLLIYFFVSLAIPVLYSNHIWHSSMSQVVGILFTISVYLFLKFPIANVILSYLGVFISSALMSGVKQNLGPPFLIATTLFLLLYKSKRDIRFILSVFFGYLFGVITMLFFTGLSTRDFLYLFTAPSSRLIPNKDLIVNLSGVRSNYLVAVVLIVLLIVFLHDTFKAKKLDHPSKFLVLALLISALPLITDWDAKLNNTSLPFMILAILLTHKPNYVVTEPSAFLKKLALPAVALALLISSTFGGYSRERTSHGGLFYEKPVSYKIETKLFKGLHTGKKLMKIEKELARIAKNEKGKIFMGPRIEFAYFETNNVSPKGLPLYWFPGTSYAESDKDLILRNFISNNFNLCVLVGDENEEGDLTQVPIEIKSYLEKNFYRDLSYKALVVLRRK